MLKKNKISTYKKGTEFVIIRGGLDNYTFLYPFKDTIFRIGTIGTVIGNPYLIGRASLMLSIQVPNRRCLVEWKHFKKYVINKHYGE
jgi:hypothetical protein